MNKRTFDGLSNNTKKVKFEEIYNTRKIVIRDDNDPHVFLNLVTEYVKIGTFVYKVKSDDWGWHKINDIDTRIGLNLTQYNDISEYVFDKQILVKSFMDNVVDITKIKIGLKNYSTHKIIAEKDKLTSNIIDILSSHIVTINQNFSIIFNEMEMELTIMDLDDNEKIMGMMTKYTQIDYDYSEYDNIIIYGQNIGIDSSLVRVIVKKCICLKSMVNNDNIFFNENDNDDDDDDDDDETFSGNNFPLIIEKKTIDKYVRDSIKDTFVDDDIIIYTNDNYEFTFNLKIIDINKQTKYKNTYKLVGKKLMDILSNTDNIIITDGIKTANKICLNCQEYFSQNYDVNDYIIVVDDVINFIKEKIKIITIKQSIKYTNQKKKNIMLKINYINPHSNHTVMYHIKENTNITFDVDNKSKFILVKNSLAEDATKITFNIKKSVANNFFDLLFSTKNDTDKTKLINSKKLEKIIRNLFPKKTAIGHKMKVSYGGNDCVVKVKDIVFKNPKITDSKKQKYKQLAHITDETEFKFETSKNDKSLTLNTNSNILVNPVQELEKYVGGISKQLEIIVRSLCLSRGKLKDEFLSRGLKPIKGIILYGPPGCGKTKLARNIGKIFGCQDDRFRLMSGPEVFNKWVGSSEKNVRQIFKPAKDAWKKYGASSPLYMVVIDEIDAMLPSRDGSSASPVRDSVVNQFLAEIDGLEEFNNLIVIGITNRLELIDTAAIRPGRLGVHIRIDLPDKKGRIEIFEIHTKKLKELNKLDNINFEKLAGITDNFSGADIENVVVTASTFSLERLNKLDKIDEQIIESQGKITDDDFIKAIDEIKTLNKKLNTGIVHYMYL